MNVKIYLKTPKEKESLLYFAYYYNNKRLRTYSNIKIAPKSWSKSKQKIHSKDDTNNLNQTIYNQKNSIESALSGQQQYTHEQAKAIANKIIKENKIVTTKYIATVTETFDPDYEKEYGGAYGYAPSIEKIEDYTSLQRTDTNLTLIDLTNQFIKANELEYKESTIKQYKQFKNDLITTNTHDIPVSQMTIEIFNEKFRDYFLKKNHTNSTINKKIKDFKAVVRHYDQLHPLTLVKRLKDNPKKTFFVLDKTELNAIRTYTKYTKSQSKTKDIFLFQCLTGLSIVDLKAITPNDFEDDILTINREKSDKECYIHLDDETMAIAKKYNYTLLTISDQNYRKGIKKVVEKAGINYDVTMKRRSGNKTIRETKAAYKFCSSHTARRIFITHNLIDKTPINIIAIQTGHKLATVELYNHTSKAMLKDYYKDLEKDD